MALLLVAVAVVAVVGAQIDSESANEMRVVFPHPSIAIRLIQCLGTNLNVPFDDLMGMVPLENGWTDESAGAFEAALVTSLVDVMRTDGSVDSSLVSQIVSGCLEREAGANGRTYGERLNLLLRRSLERDVRKNTGKRRGVSSASSSATSASNSVQSGSSASVRAEKASPLSPGQPMRNRFQRNRELGGQGKPLFATTGGNRIGVDSDREMSTDSRTSVVGNSMLDENNSPSARILSELETDESKTDSRKRVSLKNGAESSAVSSALVSSVADSSLDSPKLKGSKTKSVENSDSELSDLLEFLSSRYRMSTKNPSNVVTSSTGVSKASSTSQSSAIESSIVESSNSLADTKTSSHSETDETLLSSKEGNTSGNISGTSRSKSTLFDMFKLPSIKVNQDKDSDEIISSSLDSSIITEVKPKSESSAASSSISSASSGTKSVLPDITAVSSSSSASASTSSVSSKSVLVKKADEKGQTPSTSSNEVEVPLKKEVSEDADEDPSDGLESELMQIERLIKNTNGSSILKTSSDKTDSISKENLTKDDSSKIPASEKGTEINEVEQSIGNGGVDPLLSDPKSTFVSLLEEAISTSAILKSSLNRLDSHPLNTADFYNLIFNSAQWAGVLNAREVAERLSQKNGDTRVLTLSSYLRGSAVAVAEMLVSRSILTQENVKSLSRLYVNRIELALQMEEIEIQREFYQVLADVNQRYLSLSGVLESEMIEFSQYFGREILFASVGSGAERDSSIEKLSDVLRSENSLREIKSTTSSAASVSEQQASQSSTSATSSADASYSVSSSSSDVSASSKSTSDSRITSVSTASAKTEELSTSGSIETDENLPVASFVDAFLRNVKSYPLLPFSKIKTFSVSDVREPVIKVLSETVAEAGLPESFSTARVISDALKRFDALSSSQFQTFLLKSVGRFLSDVGLLSVITSEYLAAAFVNAIEAEAKTSPIENAASLTRVVAIGLVKFFQSLGISTEEILSKYPKYAVEELGNLKSGDTAFKNIADIFPEPIDSDKIDPSSFTKSDDTVQVFSSEAISSIIKVYSSLESFKEISETKISTYLARKTLLKALESSNETLKFSSVESIMKIITAFFKGSSQDFSLSSLVTILGNTVGHILYENKVLTLKNYKELSQSFANFISKRMKVLKSTDVTSYVYSLMHGTIDFLYSQQISGENSFLSVANVFNSQYQSFQNVSVAKIESSEQSVSNITISQQTTSNEGDSLSNSSSETLIESFKSTFKASLSETMSSSKSLTKIVRSETTLSSLSEAFHASLSNHSKTLNLPDDDSIAEIASTAFEDFPDTVPYTTLIQSCAAALAHHLSQKGLLTPKNVDRLSEKYVAAIAAGNVDDSFPESLFGSTFRVLESFGIGGLRDLRHVASLFNSHFQSSLVDPEVLATSSDFVHLLLRASPDILTSGVLFSDAASARVSAMSSFVTSALTLAEEGGIDAVTFLRAVLALVSRVNRNSPDLPFGQVLIEALLESNLALVRVVNSSGVRSVNFAKSSEVTTVMMKALRNWTRD